MDLSACLYNGLEKADDMPVIIAILVAAYVAQRNIVVRRNMRATELSKARKRRGRGAPGFPRRSRPRQSRTEGCFARIVFAPDVADATSLTSEEFRETFRIPFVVFTDIVSLIGDCKWACKRGTDNSGRPSIKLEILVAASLKRLGSGTSYKDLARCSGASASVLVPFFHKFCKYFSDNRARWIHGPQSTEEIKRHMGVYNLLGLPGAIGSLDATHIPWEVSVRV